MSSKFFTNAQENTLLKKFEGIFTFAEVSQFDVLVAFFRASGYFLIHPYLKAVKHIRILVGIDVDHLISEAAKKGLEFKFNANETREEFLDELKDDIQHASYSKKVEEMKNKSFMVYAIQVAELRVKGSMWPFILILSMHI